MKKQELSRVVYGLSLSLILMLAGCAAMQESNQLWSNIALEKIIAGRNDANYVGTETCLGKCHAHDKLDHDFKLSIHGEQVATKTGTPLVDCESCHGPGSLAIEKITKVNGKETCDFSTLVDYKTIPPEAESLICLKCHSSHSLSNLSQWNGSAHSMAAVSCFDCHKIHQGPGQKVKISEINALCLSCHKEQKIKFRLTSHHPVLENKMTCWDCHNTHGTGQRKDLRGDSVKQLCVRCHAEKRGPFVAEHGDNIKDNCIKCHEPHGSMNRNINRVAQPFLCLQCHPGHNDAHHTGLASREFKMAFFGQCTVCHQSIHGSDDFGPVGGGSGLIR